MKLQNLTYKLTFLCLLMCFVACKKKSTKAEETPIQDETPSSISGNLIYTKIIYNTPPSVSNSTYILPTFRFYDKPIAPADTNSVLSVFVGNIQVNSLELSRRAFQLGSTTYYSEGFNFTSVPLHVNVAGNLSFAALSFTESGNGFPDFSNYSQLPNSISKTNGFTFTLISPVNNAVTQVSIGNTKATFIGNVISFSPSQLSGVNTSTFATLQIKRTVPSKIITVSDRNFISGCSVEYNKVGLVIAP